MDSGVAAGFVGGIQVSIFRRGTVSDEDFYYVLFYYCWLIVSGSVIVDIDSIARSQEQILLIYFVHKKIFNQ